jgi:hypothetical protein
LRIPSWSAAYFVLEICALVAPFAGDELGCEVTGPQAAVASARTSPSVDPNRKTPMSIISLAGVAGGLVFCLCR